MAQKKVRQDDCCPCMTSIPRQTVAPNMVVNKHINDRYMFDAPQTVDEVRTTWPLDLTPLDTDRGSQNEVL